MGVNKLGLVLLAFGSASAWAGTLPPPWIEVQRIVGAEVVSGDEFGTSVSVDGDLSLVGAIAPLLGPGAAYVYRWSEDQWVEDARLAASDGALDDRFGRSVDIEGDTAVVGAFLAEIAGNTHQGAVYLFHRIGGVWIEQQKLTASDGAEQDAFGSAVALNSDTLMVSSPGDDIGGNPDQGSVYVFERINGYWLEQQKIVIADGGASDLLGVFDIAIDRGRALVGAPSATVDGVVNRGAAYLLSREEGSWVEAARLTSKNAPSGASVGWAVSLEGSRAVAGAVGDTVTVQGQGTAYVFEESGGSWTEIQRLVASDAHEFGEFGRSVAIHGGRILVGGEFDTPGNPGQGAVYSFHKEGAEWVEEQKITASDGQGLDQFGGPIAADRDLCLIGASSAGAGGAAYFFSRTHLFADGFESGDTSAWSQTVPPVGADP